MLGVDYHNQAISSDPSALMAPIMEDRRVSDTGLGAEDVKVIQRLYGLKTRKSLTTLPRAMEQKQSSSDKILTLA